MFDRLEDKVIRRASKRAKLDPMIDEDSGDEEDDDFPLTDVADPSRTSQGERTRRSRTPDIRFVAEDAEAASVPETGGPMASVTTAPAFVGSALRKNGDGSVATPKVMPKRNKDSKVNKTPVLTNFRLNIASFLASKLEAKGEGVDPLSPRIRGFFRQLGFCV
jgi:hypothetical protein